MLNPDDHATIGEAADAALLRLYGRPIWKMYAPKLIVTPDAIYTGPFSIPVDDGSWIIIDGAGDFGMNMLSVHLSDEAVGLESQPDGKLNIIALGENPRTIKKIDILQREHHVPGEMPLFMDCGLAVFCEGEDNPTLCIVATSTGVRITTSPEQNEVLASDYQWRDLRS